MSKLNPNGMATKTLLSLYNEHAQELGETQIKKFADRETAERRTVAMHDRVQVARAANAAKAPLHHDKAGLARVQVAVADALAASPEPGPSPASPAKAPRWAAPKHEAPGAKAYRPKPGSVQEGMYKLLTRPEGVTMDAFIAAMADLKTKDKGFLSPPAVWSGLRYLFCSLRGYGLKFDGTRFWLLVPKVEVDAVRATKA